MFDRTFNRFVVVAFVLAIFAGAVATGCYTSRKVTTENLQTGEYKKSERLRIIYPDGEVILHDDWRLDYPWAEGRVDELEGNPPFEAVEGSPTLRRYNLEDAQSIEIYDFSGAKVGALAGAGSLAVIAVMLALMLASLSCPTVIVDMPAGPQMVGAIYPAAMSAAPDHRDHLAIPLPPPGSPLRISIRNDHRETQRIDQLAIEFVSHSPAEAAVATANGPIVVRDLRAPNVSSVELDAIAHPDGTAWQSTKFLSHSTPAARDTISVDFAEAPGATALIVRAEQTLWYQAVMRTIIDTNPLEAASMRPGADVAKWRRDQGVDAAVEIRGADGWTLAGYIPAAGLEGFRSFAIPLPAIRGPVKVRITSASGFWRFDQIALASIANPTPRVRTILPSSAAGVALETVTHADGDLFQMGRVGDHLDVSFDVPERSGTAFLTTVGSYEVHPIAKTPAEPLRSVDAAIDHIRAGRAFESRR